MPSENYIILNSGYLKKSRLLLLHWQEREYSSVLFTHYYIKLGALHSKKIKDVKVSAYFLA